jgi:hypothetical protein
VPVRAHDLQDAACSRGGVERANQLADARGVDRRHPREIEADPLRAAEQQLLQAPAQPAAVRSQKPPLDRERRRVECARH